MQEFPVTDPVLQELFDPELPNSPALWAVLRGNHPGLALVDRQPEPAQAVLRTGAALTYFSDRTSQVILDQAVSYFRQAGPVWLVWPHRTDLRPPEIDQAVEVRRLEFDEIDPHSERLKQLRRQIPAGHRIQSIDAATFQQCEWREEMEFYGGGLENFLKHGIGICIMNGSEMIVEAYASALGVTRAEIGALTREAYRGRGYAPIACAFLVEACNQRGYRPYWSCEADHHASIRVAQKLGFQRPRAYTIFEYAPFAK